MAYVDGTIKTESIPERGGLGVYRKKLKIISLILFIIGVCGIVAYLALSMLVPSSGNSTFQWPDIFLIFAVPLAIGLVFGIMFIRLDSIDKKQNASCECEFYSDCFIYRRVTALGKEEHRHGYADAVNKGEKKGYGFIFSTGKGEFSLYSLENLTDEEKTIISSLVNHTPIPSGLPELKKYTPPSQY